MHSENKERLLKMFNENAPIARHLGMRLSFNEDNNGVVFLEYNPDLDHAFGAVHGGIYATMLDSAGWFTAAIRRDSSCSLVTSEMSIHFLKPVQKTSLQAVGKMIKSGKRQDIVEMSLFDAQENLVGHAVATFMVIANAT